MGRGFFVKLLILTNCRYFLFSIFVDDSESTLEILLAFFLVSGLGNQAVNYRIFLNFLENVIASYVLIWFVLIKKPCIND